MAGCQSAAPMMRLAAKVMASSTALRRDERCFSALASPDGVVTRPQVRQGIAEPHPGQLQSGQVE